MWKTTTLVNALFYFSPWSWTLLLCTNKSKTAWLFFFFFLKKAHTNLSRKETFSRKINGWMMMMIIMMTLFHLCSGQGTEDFLLLKSLQAEHWSGGGEMRELWAGTTLPERHVFQKSDMSSKLCLSNISLFQRIQDSGCDLLYKRKQIFTFSFWRACKLNIGVEGERWENSGQGQLFLSDMYSRNLTWAHNYVFRTFLCSSVFKILVVICFIRENKEIFITVLCHYCWMLQLVKITWHWL